MLPSSESQTARALSAYAANMKGRFKLAAASQGDTVLIHYKGTLRDGSQFDSSEGRDPLRFTIGSGQVIPGFDAAAQGMTIGEVKTVEIPADQAYGQKREDLRITVPRNEIPPELHLEVGVQLQMMPEPGVQVPVEVVELGDDHIVVDANHPLAGQDLIFDLELIGLE